MTLQPRATVLRTNEFSVGVLGAISSGAEGEYVVVKGKECGIPGAFFRGLGGATTLAGGGYEASVPHPYEDHAARRVERGREPRPSVVTPRANVRLTKEPAGFRVSLTNDVESADGKRVTIERFTGTGWKKLQTVVLKAMPGYVQYAEKKKLRFKVPKGTTDPRGAPALAGRRLLPGRIQQAHPNVEEAT